MKFKSFFLLSFICLNAFLCADGTAEEICFKKPIESKNTSFPEKICIKRLELLSRSQLKVKIWGAPFEGIFHMDVLYKSEQGILGSIILKNSVQGSKKCGPAHLSHLFMEVTLDSGLKLKGTPKIEGWTGVTGNRCKGNPNWKISKYINLE